MTSQQTIPFAGFFKTFRLIAVVLLANLSGALEGNAQIVQAPSQKQLTEIDKIAAPLRKKINTILEADATGQYKTYQADLAALAREEDPERRMERVNRLERDHIAFIRAAVVKAKIDVKDFKQKVSAVLGHANFSVDEFGAIFSESQLPAQLFSDKFSITMDSPFEATEEVGGVNGFSYCSHSAFGNQVTVSSIAEVAGGCRTKGSIGDVFEIPEGTFDNISVSAKIGHAGHEGFTFALAGYSQINGKIGLRLQGGNYDQTIITHSSWAVAPLVWYKKVDVELFGYAPSVNFSGSFSAGIPYTAQVYTESFSLAVPAFTLCQLKVFGGSISEVKAGGE